MPDLPLLIGPGANGEEEQLSRLMGAVPTLRPQLTSATWVGGRRWDLNFQSGETVALPEGEESPRRLRKPSKAYREIRSRPMAVSGDRSGLRVHPIH